MGSTRDTAKFPFLSAGQLEDSFVWGRRQQPGQAHMPLDQASRRNYTLPMLHPIPLFAREPRPHAGMRDRRIAPTVTTVVSGRDLATNTPVILERRLGGRVPECASQVPSEWLFLARSTFANATTPGAKQGTNNLVRTSPTQAQEQ